MAETNNGQNQKNAGREDGSYILAVDDEQSVLELITHALTPESIDVATATEGKTALQMIAEREPDLVILDINMPGFNGIEVLEKIREGSDIPVIMLSVMNDVDTISEALAKGADDYLKKPFDTRELIVRVKAQLGHFKRR